MALNDVASNRELRIALQHDGALIVIEHLNAGEAALHEIIPTRPLQKRLLLLVERSLLVFKHVVVTGVFAKNLTEAARKRSICREIPLLHRWKAYGMTTLLRTW